MVCTYLGFVATAGYCHIHPLTTVMLKKLCPLRSEPRNLKCYVVAVDFDHLAFVTATRHINLAYLKSFHFGSSYIPGPLRGLSVFRF